MGNIEKQIFRSKKDIEIILRTAEISDAESIIELKKSVVSEGLYMLREIDETNYKKEDEIEQIENHLNNNGSLYIVAESDSKVIGILEFENGSLKRTKHAGMFTIYIMKSYRDSGIGKIMLNELISWAEKNSVIEKVTLNVFSTNPRAIHLYEKCGFKEEGRCPEDMKLSDGTYIDSVLMYKFVR